MTNEYDITIIGAGIGGLVCGCFLAKAGMKVLIIEQRSNAGGCVSSIRRKDCIFDIGAHLFGSCNKNGILGQCLSNIGVNVDFLRLNPTDRFTFPDQVIDVPNDLNRYIDLLRSRFPKESNNIDIFFNEIVHIAKHFTNTSLSKKYLKLTYQQFLDTHFSDQKLKGILSAQYLYIGARPKNASLLFMSVLLVSYLKDGVYYPKGGTQCFSDALNRKFNEYGGESVFNKRVDRIIVKGKNMVEGVEFSDKKKINSKFVIANSDASKTFFDLFSSGEIPSEYSSRIKRYKKSKSLFLLYFAIKNYAADISKHRGWHFDSYDMNGKTSNPLYVFIPTLLDHSLAPAGVHAIESIIEFPREYEKVSDWDLCKMQLQEAVFNKIERIMGSLKKNLYYLDSATPATFERFTGNSEGAIYGWEMSHDQVSNNRLQQETPFKNMYLVGHWTVPGCGVPSVAVSGWALAKKILKSYKAATMNVRG